MEGEANTLEEERVRRPSLRSEITPAGRGAARMSGSPEGSPVVSFPIFIFSSTSCSAG
jgi:hypothetical protein